MGQFLTVLEGRFLPETDGIELFQLSAPLRFQSKILGLIEVPADFITDFVSLDVLNYTAHRPSATHDFLYCCKDVPREIADLVLKEMLESICENPILVELMYVAVRSFGASHHTESDLIYTLKGVHA